MSKTINSVAEFQNLLNTSKIVVADFHATWCGPCKNIAPLYEQLAAQLSRPNKITFTKIDVEKVQDLAKAYEVTAMPTFKLFKNRQVIKTIKGADPKELSAIVKKLANEAESLNDASGLAESSGSSTWMGGDPAKGYSNITDQTDLKGLELLNFDSGFGNVRTLFESSKPSALSTGDKSKSKDWVESDTDDQLMLYIPFQATLKIHSIHLTSIPPYSDDDDVPMRPKTIQVYVNRSHILGFEEAEDSPVTQTITINQKDWDDTTGTAKVDLRFVKFQNVTSLVIFVVDGDGEGDKVRLDRVRVIGESGERRDGKIEKMGDDHD